METSFINYCKNHRTLTVPNSKFIITLGGGMAVKLYLKSQGINPLPKKVEDTHDFDFTFAVSHALTPIEVERYSLQMYNYMYKFISGFIRPDKLKIRSYARKSIIRATGKKTYHVVQFKTLNNEDFVDCTLAYIPGLSRNEINNGFSRKYGFPIKRLKYIYKDVLVVLAGSFVYKHIKTRNPITGKDKKKGIKNTARVSALQKLKITSPKTPSTSHFLSAIRANNTNLATLKARSIIKKIAALKKKTI
jgi:hypothetical protein